MLSRVVFIACYGLGFRLLGSQATGVFVYFGLFRRPLEASRSLMRRRPLGGAPGLRNPSGGRPGLSGGLRAFFGGLLRL
jgi:hypothetical protein